MPFYWEEKKKKEPKPLKYHYKRGNKYFYRKGRLRMCITKIHEGAYKFDGDFIEGEIQLPNNSISSTLSKTYFQ